LGWAAAQDFEMEIPTKFPTRFLGVGQVARREGRVARSTCMFAPRFKVVNPLGGLKTLLITHF
jgi:hypothetical protein